MVGSESGTIAELRMDEEVEPRLENASPDPQGDGVERADASQGGREHAIPWGEIRRVYELTETPTIEILRRYGLTKSQLRWRRQSETWETRPSAAMQKRKASEPERLRARMLSLHAVMLARLEEWVAGVEDFETSQARAFAVLAAGLDHITRSDEREVFEMAKRAAKPTTATAAREKKNSDAGYDFRNDPAWLDAEINRRLDRLQERGGEDAHPGDAASGTEAGVGGGLARDLGET